MCTGVNTHMSKRTHLHMHWCSRHLFSACHTHHNTCTWQHLHIHAYADSMATTSPWKLLRTIRESWDCILCHWWYKETYWVELETRPKHPTQNMLGELPRLSHSPRTPPHPTRSYLFTVSLPPHKSPSKFTRAHDAVAATLPYKRHLIIHVSARWIQLIQSILLRNLQADDTTSTHIRSRQSGSILSITSCLKRRRLNECVDVIWQSCIIVIWQFFQSRHVWSECMHV